MSEEREQTRWEQIQERGKNDVFIYQCLSAMRAGAMDKEAALETMVLALSAHNEDLTKSLTRAIAMAPPPPILIPAQDIIAAGWLPPCEGRRKLEIWTRKQGINPYLNLAPGRYRLILDPLPAKEGDG